MNEKHGMLPESPCYHCEKDRDCKHICCLWDSWFRKRWQEIQLAGNKMKDGDPGGS